jgi:hypothetical protein
MGWGDEAADAGDRGRSAFAIGAGATSHSASAQRSLGREFRKTASGSRPKAEKLPCGSALSCLSPHK